MATLGAVVAVVVIAVVAWLFLKGRSASSAAQLPEEPAAPPPAVRPPPKHLVSKRPASGALLVTPTHDQLPSGTPTSLDLMDAPTAAEIRAARLAETGILTRVSCKDSEAVYGAMPPYGSLSMDGDVLCFAARSRVITKAAGHDGSQTLQSLGTVEVGDYQLRLTRITNVRFAGNKAYASGREGEWELALLGPNPAELREFCQQAQLPGA